jgi:peptidoglycan/xylan/chitin deacetylase (PgdA/CDA1 family)
MPIEPITAIHPASSPGATALALKRSEWEIPGPVHARWLRILAGALYHGGALRGMQIFSRYWELRQEPPRKLPRLARVSTPKYVVLCYHRIGTEGIPLYNGVPPEVFEEQMALLCKRYRVISLAQLYSELQGHTGQGDAIAITFDDGYRDLYTHAYPVLRKYGVPATIFLVANCIETGDVPWYDRIFLALKVFPRECLEVNLNGRRHFELSSAASRIAAATEIIMHLRSLPDLERREWCLAWEREVPLPEAELAGRMLTWDQVREMERSGICFGSHTLTHPVVSQLPSAVVERELRESKELIEQRLGVPVWDFAYPFGKPADCGSAAEPMLTSCAYRSAMTTTEGINVAGFNPYRLRRTQIGNSRSLSMFTFYLTKLFLQANANSSTVAAGASVAEERIVLQDDLTS